MSAVSTPLDKQWEKKAILVDADDIRWVSEKDDGTTIVETGRMNAWIVMETAEEIFDKMADAFAMWKGGTV
jgi:hypothetical protein